MFKTHDVGILICSLKAISSITLLTHVLSFLPVLVCKKPGSYKEMSSIFADQCALVYEPQWEGGGGGAGSQPMSTAVHIT
jgi:hypothetical protein